MPVLERKIITSKNFFDEYEALQDTHFQDILSHSGGEEVDWRNTYFTFPLLSEKCGHYHLEDRWYNWHIPLASLDPNIHYAHCTMIAHGVFFTAVIWEWLHKPIDLDNPMIQHIEKAKDLCVKSIEYYWVLVQAIPTSKAGKTKFEEHKEDEIRLQEEYLRSHIEMCEVVSWDLERARKLKLRHLVETEGKEDNASSQLRKEQVEDEADGVEDVDKDVEMAE
jgi:hypothetical protein